MELKRVVVTGLGALTPLGNDLETTWSKIKDGVSGAGPITHFDPDLFKTKFACEVKNFDISKYFDKKEARKLDRYAQYAVAATEEAIIDSEMDLDSVNKDRIGVIWGSGIGGLETFQEETFSFEKHGRTPRFNPFFIPKMIADIAGGHISIKYGFRGPNFTTVSACASSSNAIMDAFNYIRLGKADAIITGGSEASVTISGVGGFNALQALSTKNDDPKTASRPFDKDRDGFVIGEGGACLVLEEYEHAKKRGAKMYAEVIGAGASADAYHMTAPHPEGAGAKLVMLNALEDAGLNPQDIEHINMHGTSTPLGDVAEVKAIQDVFKDHAYNINLNSTKSMTGHLLGAAGALEAIFVIKSIIEGIIPPTINHFTDDPEIDTKLNFTFNKAQKRDIKIAMSNTFGFGGHNACVIFKRFEDK